MSFRTLIFSSILSISIAGNVFATSSPSTPVQQFQYAQQLAANTKAEVRYWLEQSANQGYLPAQKQLAQDFSEGITGSVSYTQAIYWLTSVAINDPQDKGYLLAKFLEDHQKHISISELIEAWYQLSSTHNPQAEAAYNLLLEQRFNQLRAKQVSEIEELDEKAAKQQNELSRPTDEPNISRFKPVLAIGILSIIMVGGWFGYRAHQQRKLTHSQREATQTQQLDKKVKELEFTNKQLKYQLEKVFNEFKKTKSDAERHKLEVACAVFGYTPQTIPEPKSIKLRYRQLSKLYHPDSRGSEDEMKRLNQAFALITQNVTKS